MKNKQIIRSTCVAIYNCFFFVKYNDTVFVGQILFLSIMTHLGGGEMNLFCVQRQIPIQYSRQPQQYSQSANIYILYLKC